MEAGLTTRAQDYTRVLAQHLSNTIAQGQLIDQTTFPGWVTNTLHLADKLKYLVRQSSTMKHSINCNSQDPVYTTSSGEMSEIGDPEWLGEFSNAVLSLSHPQFSGQTDIQADLG